MALGVLDHQSAFASCAARVFGVVAVAAREAGPRAARLLESRNVGLGQVGSRVARRDLQTKRLDYRTDLVRVVADLQLHMHLRVGRVRRALAVARAAVAHEEAAVWVLGILVAGTGVIQSTKARVASGAELLIAHVLFRG